MNVNAKTEISSKHNCSEVFEWWINVDNTAVCIGTLKIAVKHVDIAVMVKKPYMLTFPVGNILAVCLFIDAVIIYIW